jgi:hypothetical protein
MCPRTKPLYVCPHAKARYVSSILSLYVCVLIRECLLVADAAAMRRAGMRKLRSDSVCVLILSLYMCPHTKPVCLYPHTNPLCMCPHTQPLYTKPLYVSA